MLVQLHLTGLYLAEYIHYVLLYMFMHTEGFFFPKDHSFKGKKKALNYKSSDNTVSKNNPVLQCCKSTVHYHLYTHHLNITYHLIIQPLSNIPNRSMHFFSGLKY